MSFAALKSFMRRDPPPVRRPPMLELVAFLPDLPGAEPYEYPVVPDAYGDATPDIDAFVAWCVTDMHLDGFRNIKALWANWDAFARLQGYQRLTECQLSRLVPHSDRLEKWRDRKHGNTTRYRIVEP